MRRIKSALEHLSISMLLGLMVLVYLDGRNPYMAFLTSGVSKVYILLAAALGIASAVLGVAESRKR